MMAIGVRASLRRIAWGLALAYLVWAGLLFALQRRILFAGEGAPAPPFDGGPPDLERLWLDTPEGKVEAWLLPGRGVSAERPGGLVIHAHGNAELIDHWPLELAPYRAMGFSVLLPEYRGYGRSAGTAGQAHITADLIALRDQVVARPEVDPRRVVYHGRSLGGGAVCALSQARPPAALILESTFTSVAHFARRFLLPRFLVRDPFDNLACVRGARSPLLVIHGRRDAIIPFWHGEALAAAAADAERLWLDCGHNDCPPDRALYWQRIRAFMGRLP